MHTRSLHLKCFLLAVAVALVPSLGFAGINDKTYGSVLVKEITSIYDGDTFRANIEGWPPIVGERVPVRLMGIDTPELRGNVLLRKDWLERLNNTPWQCFEEPKK